ncbi:hypothetical protein X975_08530, partial [Stegodyphus mimosarum]
MHTPHIKIQNLQLSKLKKNVQLLLQEPIFLLMKQISACIHSEI